MQDKKIVNYRMIRVTSDESISPLIQDMIKQGWQPYGSPFLQSNYPNSGIAQAMVEYEEEKKENEQ